jgi:SAM-dependent methyltransferase
MPPCFSSILKMENCQMFRNAGRVIKKIWERISGIEPRRLWLQLTNTQNELTNTQNELTYMLLRRDNRIHPFVLEALSLVKPEKKNLFPIPKEIDFESNLFTEFGSDKNTRHSYAEIYFSLLKDKSKPRILEIGVGSENDFPYAGLRAGGGLQAFRKKFPDAEIIGLDIDPESIKIIKNLGFKGYVMDQTSTDSLMEVKTELLNMGRFDLIIDDGFHDPHANVRTLMSLYDLLAHNGSYVIEDVHETLIDFWKVISAYLPGEMELIDLRNLRPGVDDNILILFEEANKSHKF